MDNTFRANGKLLLTGEYFVLDGVKALAVPTRLGQTLHIDESVSQPNRIIWKALDVDSSCWGEAIFDASNLNILSKKNDFSNLLQKLFIEIQIQNPLFFKQFENGISITTKLEFSRHWGLGSSSTLISLLAQWSKTNPYQLLSASFGGSGYDIACATATSPIFYQLINEGRNIEPTNFNPIFHNSLYFIYLGKKQNSRTAIQNYRSKGNPSISDLKTAQELSDAIAFAPELHSFQNAITEHESFIGHYLDLQPVQQVSFPDFQGVVKSLGGWGGDFVLAASEMDEQDVVNYFKVKGFEVVLTFKDLILSQLVTPPI